MKITVGTSSQKLSTLLGDKNSQFLDALDGHQAHKVLVQNWHDTIDLYFEFSADATVASGCIIPAGSYFEFTDIDLTNLELIASSENNNVRIAINA